MAMSTSDVELAGGAWLCRPGMCDVDSLRTKVLLPPKRRTRELGVRRRSAGLSHTDATEDGRWAALRLLLRYDRSTVCRETGEPHVGRSTTRPGRDPVVDVEAVAELDEDELVVIGSQRAEPVGRLAPGTGGREGGGVVVGNEGRGGVDHVHRFDRVEGEAEEVSVLADTLGIGNGHQVDEQVLVDLGASPRSAPVD